jgi:hypothetical protein
VYLDLTTAAAAAALLSVSITTTHGKVCLSLLTHGVAAIPLTHLTTAPAAAAAAALLSFHLKYNARWQGVPVPAGHVAWRRRGVQVEPQQQQLLPDTALHTEHDLRGGKRHVFFIRNFVLNANFQLVAA